MSQTDAAATYVNALKKRLGLNGLRIPFVGYELIDEVEDHLREAVEAGQAEGLSAEEAAARAVERFGAVDVVARGFESQLASQATNASVVWTGVAVGVLAALTLSPWPALAALALAAAVFRFGVPRVLRWPAALLALVAGDWVLVVTASQATEHHTATSFAAFVAVSMAVLIPSAYAVMRLGFGLVPMRARAR
jgi:hypothetical protein